MFFLLDLEFTFKKIMVIIFLNKQQKSVLNKNCLKIQYSTKHYNEQQNFNKIILTIRPYK